MQVILNTLQTTNHIFYILSICYPTLWLLMIIYNLLLVTEKNVAQIKIWTQVSSTTCWCDIYYSNLDKLNNLVKHLSQIFINNLCYNLSTPSICF